MHSVDRGAEPPGLARLRQRLTAAWIQHYRHGTGNRPTDRLWGRFRDHLEQAFLGICGYCEEYCKGTVDHFRPKGRYPELVYEWKNWVFACPCCNTKKGEQWPGGGFVDPCARSVRCESFFTFDLKTAQILPRSDLRPSRRKKALQTIEGLGLNDYHHLKKRVQWLKAVAIAVERVAPGDPARGTFTAWVASRERELSSITRQYLIENGYMLGVTDRGARAALGERPEVRARARGRRVRRTAVT